MTAQDILAAAQLTRVRELRTQLEKAAAENARLAAENEQLTAHLDLAILAAEDLRTLPNDGHFVIVDGWNMILGAYPPDKRPAFCARNPEELKAEARAYLTAHPSDFVWLVFDGPHEHVDVENRLRISYTGGIGSHRADRFICDFLRMAKFRGSLQQIVVETRDRDFRKIVQRLMA